jgi:uncharacterized protein YneF (UPF0154 family)
MTEFTLWALTIVASILLGFLIGWTAKEFSIMNRRRNLATNPTILKLFKWARR